MVIIGHILHLEFVNEHIITILSMFLYNHYNTVYHYNAVYVLILSNPADGVIHLTGLLLDIRLLHSFPLVCVYITLSSASS